MAGLVVFMPIMQIEFCFQCELCGFALKYKGARRELPFTINQEILSAYRNVLLQHFCMVPTSSILYCAKGLKPPVISLLAQEFCSVLLITVCAEISTVIFTCSVMLNSNDPPGVSRVLPAEFHHCYYYCYFNVVVFLTDRFFLFSSPLLGLLKSDLCVSPHPPLPNLLHARVLGSALSLVSSFCRPTADCLFCWTWRKHGWTLHWLKIYCWARLPCDLYLEQYSL